MLCRFENRRSGTALALDDFVERIDVTTEQELLPALEHIEQRQRDGYWVGLIAAYELGEWLEPGCFPPASPHDTPSPRLSALVFRSARREPVWPAPAAAKPEPLLRSRTTMDYDDYRTALEILRERIRNGDFYQVNYTFPVHVQSVEAPEMLYRRLANRHPSEFAAYIDDGQQQILSFSPELFLQRRHTTLTARPMKGTAPRMADADADQAAADALLASAKDRAENVMIVDLLRNDLGRIATPGTVRVPALFTLEKYPSVWTLTSTITARAPGTGLLTLLQALFPCGSITGAPKIAAMHAIRQLEPHPRGVYCGSLGWLAPGGDFCLNVAIRTLVFHNSDSGVFGVGGGIVYDSNPALEWQECHWKARIVNLELP